MKKFIIVVVLILATSANAEIFKCEDAAGKAVYQNTPCPDDKGQFIDLKKNTKISVEEYKKNKEKEEARIKIELEEAEKIRKQQAESYPTYTDSTSGYSSSSRYSGSRSIYTGPRGGRYYYNSSGNKTYVGRGRSGRRR
ncbi:MAG: DUF4124 domain-containing protein [Candidatus Competibacter sp.]